MLWRLVPSFNVLSLCSAAYENIPFVGPLGGWLAGSAGGGGGGAGWQGQIPPDTCAHEKAIRGSFGWLAGWLGGVGVGWCGVAGAVSSRHLRP